MKNIKGFTLVELLVTISIIGILAGVVMVSTTSSVQKAKRASALTSASSVLPEIASCQDDGGNVSVPSTTSSICNVSGHTQKWPDISSSGWTYSGSEARANDSYSFTVQAPSGSSESNIVCEMANNACK